MRSRALSSKELTVRVTNECDGHCPYCYLASRAGTISDVTLEILAARVEEFLTINSETQLRIVWHGGEPTSIGLNKWREIMSLFKPISRDRVSFYMQTNLLCHDRSLLEFLISEGIHLSTSLDGDLETHCSTRHTSSEDYKLLLDNINVVMSMQDSLGVVCVLNRLHLGQETRLLDFFESVGCSVRFNRCTADNADGGLGYVEHFRTLQSLASKWVSNGLSRITVLPVEDDIMQVLGDSSQTSCDRSPNCGCTIICASTDGSIYPCNRYVDNSLYRVGNLADISFDEAYLRSSDRMKRARQAPLDDCMNCEWARCCGYGCTWEIEASKSDCYSDYCVGIRKYFSYLSQLAKEFH